MRIGILEPDGFSAAALARLAAIGSVSCYGGGPRAAFLAEIEALFVRLGHFVGDSLLSEAPGLKIVCSPTTGHTHLDLTALGKRGVAVLSLKGETAFLETIRATPEHTLGLMIALIRNYRLAFQDRQNAHWDRDRCRGEELAGMTVGIIGYGRVGRRVASYLDALGAQVSWCDPNVENGPPNHERRRSALEVIERSRMVVLAASYAEGQQPVLGLQEISALDGRYFVNTARGELVDELALLDAVEAGRLAGCAVDVIADENGAPARERWIAAAANPSVIVTPHIAGATVTSMRATEEFLVEKLERYLVARPLEAGS